MAGICAQQIAVDVRRHICLLCAMTNQEVLKRVQGRGVSVTEVARATGLSVNYISRLRRGTVIKEPSGIKLDKIRRFFESQEGQ